MHRMHQQMVSKAAESAVAAASLAQKKLDEANTLHLHKQKMQSDQNYRLQFETILAANLESTAATKTDSN